MVLGACVRLRRVVTRCRVGRRRGGSGGGVGGRRGSGGCCGSCCGGGGCCVGCCCGGGSGRCCGVDREVVLDINTGSMGYGDTGWLLIHFLTFLTVRSIGCCDTQLLLTLVSLYRVFPLLVKMTQFGNCIQHVLY